MIIKKSTHDRYIKKYEQVLKLYGDGNTFADACKEVGISTSTFYNICKILEKPNLSNSCQQYDTIKQQFVTIKAPIKKKSKAPIKKKTKAPIKKKTKAPIKKKPKLKSQKGGNQIIVESESESESESDKKNESNGNAKENLFKTMALGDKLINKDKN